MNVERKYKTLPKMVELRVMYTGRIQMGACPLNLTVV